MMIRNLLRTRFGLAFHLEKKDFEVFALVVAKNGPKLKTAPEANPADADTSIARPVGLDEDGFPQLSPGKPGLSGRGGNGRMKVTAQMQSAADIAKWVGFNLRSTHIVDKTGLTGKYNFKLEYATPGPTVSTSPEIPSDPVGAMPTALEQQLGLKIEKFNAPLDVIVIDHVNTAPTGN